MKPVDRDAAYLWDMVTAARLISQFIEGQRYIHFQENKMLQSAVERQLGIIGEAARYISKEFRAAHPDIPWRSIIGLRNILDLSTRESVLLPDQLFPNFYYAAS